MKYLALILLPLLLMACQGGKKTAEQSKPFTNTTACIFAQLAYCKDPQAKADKYLPGWKIIWDATALNGNHALVATDEHNYVIAIRGSLMEFSWDAFENWVNQDLNVISQEKWSYSDVPGAKISTGAYRGWNNIIQLKDKKSGKDLLSFLKEHTDKNTPLYITGHSLGGNLATVIAPWLTVQFKEAGRIQSLMNVITFAAPAAGNEEFAEDFNKKFPESIRVENTHDIVPKFPCTSAVTDLGKLYSDSLSAGSISVGYQQVSVSLTTAFKMISGAILLTEYKNGLSHFQQTSGTGMPVTVKLSGKNNSNDIGAWFAEAGYQHGIAQYATALGAPVLECN
jgi:triacylglycerol lipase